MNKRFKMCCIIKSNQTFQAWCTVFYRLKFSFYKNKYLVRHCDTSCHVMFEYKRGEKVHYSADPTLN